MDGENQHQNGEEEVRITITLPSHIAKFLQSYKEISKNSIASYIRTAIAEKMGREENA